MFWRQRGSQAPWLGYVAAVSGAFVVFVGFAVVSQVSWAFAQPASVNTMTPSVHALWQLGGVAMGCGVLLGLGRPQLPRAEALGSLALLAVVVAVASSVVAFAVCAMIALAQPCTGETCDIAAAPVSVMVAGAVGSVTAIAVVGTCIFVATARALVPDASRWSLGVGG